MEGGVLIESSPQNSNYYCYMCAEEVRPIFPEIKCPICLNGFIELVAEYNLDENQVNTDLEGVDPVANPRSGVFGGIGIYHGFSEPVRDDMGEILAEALQNELLPLQSGAALPFSAEHFLRDLRVYPTDMHTTSGQSADPDAQRNASNIVWDMMQLYLEFNQSSDVVDSFEWDALITQLLNETDYSVSQPLSKEKIEEIPLISLEEQHVEKSFQCAICMEDFNVKDLAKVLPCQHFYHEVCIIPWFETHSTCPVCRQSLDSGSVNDEETDGPSSSISEGSNFAVTHGNSGVSHQSSVPGNLDADLALLSLEPRHSS